MEYRNFAEITERARSLSTPKRGVVAGAEDLHVLEAVFEAQRQKIATPLLVGEGTHIAKLVKSLGHDPESCHIVDVPGGENPAQRAVERIASGEADFLIKGKIETKDLLKPVVDRKNNLHTDQSYAKGLMSHLSFFQIPGMPKLVAVTDGGMVVYPDLEMKKGILLNALNTFRKMGYTTPKAAILCAIEKPHDKMKETLDAQALAEMCVRGQLGDCIVEGPISYDIAMSPSIAEIKGYPGKNCGNFDVLLVPDLVCGNILGKSLAVTAQAPMAGIVVGARIPIVLTSRGSSAEEKFNSIALCAVAS